YHEPRQVFAANHEKAGEQSHQGCRARRQHEPADWLSPAVLGEKPRCVCADAEECGVTERDDARVAENQIEREREQRRDHDLTARGEIPGEEKVRHARDKPEDSLALAPLLRRQAHQPRFPSTPRGTASSIATITT